MTKEICKNLLKENEFEIVFKNSIYYCHAHFVQLDFVDFEPAML